MTHLFIAPHFDDVVYSCGARVAALTEAGEAVCVATVMAGVPDSWPDTPIVRDLHARWQVNVDPNPVVVRQREDRQAVSLLGATTHHLFIPDCVYRQTNGRALYPDEASLFGEIQPDDPAVPALRSIAWQDIVSDLSSLYLPLSIGRHVDHRIVQEWGRDLAWPVTGLYWYADYPYTRQPDAWDEALHRLERPVRPTAFIFDDGFMSRKIKAILAYETQVSTFWLSPAHVLEDVRRAFAHEAGYIERYWVVPEHPDIT